MSSTPLKNEEEEHVPLAQRAEAVWEDLSPEKKQDFLDHAKYLWDRGYIQGGWYEDHVFYAKRMALAADEAKDK